MDANHNTISRGTLKKNAWSCRFSCISCSKILSLIEIQCGSKRTHVHNLRCFTFDALFILVYNIHLEKDKMLVTIKVTTIQVLHVELMYTYVCVVK